MKKEETKQFQQQVQQLKECLSILSIYGKVLWTKEEREEGRGKEEAGQENELQEHKLTILSSLFYDPFPATNIFVHAILFNFFENITLFLK